MASLEYGMYGYTVINPNGETSQRVTARISNAVNAVYGTSTTAPARFTLVETDDYGLVQVDGEGNYTTILVPESGLYGLAVLMTGTKDANGAPVQIDVYADTTYFLDSANNYRVGRSSQAYRVASSTNYTAGGVTSGVQLYREVYLEKGRYITPFLQTSTTNWTTDGYAPTMYFSLTLISTEKSGKISGSV